MRHDQSKAELTRRLGKPLKQLTPREAFETMLTFYEEQRANVAPLDEDGDMLLYQWGPDDEKTFLMDLTRQFVLSEEDEPYQLSLTFYFDSDADLKKLKDGNEWCSTPDDLPKFRKFIDRSAAFKQLADRKAKRAALNFSAC